MKLLTTFLSFFCLSCVFSQEAVLATGAEANGTGGSASYSVGQVNYIETATGFSVSQGVQQAYTSFTTVEAVNLRLSVYPNPTVNTLYVEVKNFGYPELEYHLYDMNGNLLEAKKSSGNITGFLMTRFAAGVYLLRVSHNNKPVRSFKVIKN